MLRSGEGGCVMPDEAVPGAGPPVLKTLADRVNWLISRARPADGGPLSNADVCRMILKATDEEFSVTTIWKLRNGQQTNPQMRVVQALATTFGVAPAFFFEDYDEDKLGLLQDQVELLALVRDAGITSAELRAILGMDATGRKALASLIGHAPRRRQPLQARAKLPAPAEPNA
jgi:transcriptional regulator with XRE-family HTH domain